MRILKNCNSDLFGNVFLVIKKYVCFMKIVKIVWLLDFKEMFFLEFFVSLVKKKKICEIVVIYFFIVVFYIECEKI